MRILAMPAYFWPHRGGIETITLALAKEWSRLSHDVTVLTSKIGSNKSYETIGNIKIERTGKKTLMGCPISPNIIKKIILNKPDIAYLHYPHPIFLDLSVVGSIIGRIPYVLHVHGPEIKYDDWKNMPISIYNNTCLRFAAANASAIVSHTKAAVENSPILSRYKHKIRVIPHGTNMPPINSKLINIRKRLGLEKNKIMLFMGMLRDYKRVDILIRSFLFVSGQIPDARLLIVGEGPYREEWFNLAKELGLSDKIIFTGSVTESEKWAYYYAANVFVLPSPTLMESFGTVALEAASCKKPVIVTGSGVAELFDKEGIGIVVEPFNVQALADKIIDLLLHPTKADRIGRFGHDVIIRKYLWENQASEYITLFDQVLHGAIR